MDASRFDPQRRLARSDLGQYTKGVDESEVVETPVGHPGVVRIAEQVIHAVYAEGVTDDDLR